MIEKIKNGLGKPAGWMYFILVVALLIIVSNNGDKVDNLQADLDSANTEISTLETTLEAAANEIAVRDDAITGMEANSAEVNAKLNDSDSLRGELEMEVADLQTRLSASASALDASSSALNDAIANPVCPVCLECPAVEPTVTE
jgi:chromosome segregation ATPase